MKNTIPRLDKKFRTPFYDEDGNILIDVIQLNTRIEDTEMYEEGVLVSGFGRPDNEKPYADRLKYTILLSATSSDRAGTWVVGLPPGRGFCKGDSGGKIYDLSTTPPISDYY